MRGLKYTASWTIKSYWSACAIFFVHDGRDFFIAGLIERFVEFVLFALEIRIQLRQFGLHCTAFDIGQIVSFLVELFSDRLDALRNLAQFVVAPGKLLFKLLLRLLDSG